MKLTTCVATLTVGVGLGWIARAGEGIEQACIGGIYPSLAYYNGHGECGTGAVCPWAGSLWLVTYGPHCPVGGSDKLYQVTPDLKLVTRPESVGGTHADRMIHRESQQLFIGTYLVDKDGKVRTIPIHTMPGRLTGAARHLTDPKNKIYVTDMEEALYELDVNSLETFTLIRDGHNAGDFNWLFKELKVQPPKGWSEAEASDLFGYHGKGTCSGFGRVFYANNGWYCPEAMRNPAIPAGALADWQPGRRNWNLIRPNQFTDITTRDGVYGNEHPDTNPIWAMGWDAKSVILSVTTNGRYWVDYRLPKGSHSYDGAHGWNTEWPRIREIGNPDIFLATMHGTFWKFPSDFRPGHARGVRPRSNYLKVVGDFCAWNGKVVLGCDDSAMNEFMNTRSVKGKIKGPAKSHSNLRFVDEAELDRMGPAIGNAIVWNREDVTAGGRSVPYLLAGYAHKWAWVSEGAFAVQVDSDGSGHWKTVGEIVAGGNDLSSFDGEWVRFIAKEAVRGTTVALCFRAEDARSGKVAEWKTMKLGSEEKALLHVNEIDPKALSISVGKKGYQVKVEGEGERAKLVISDCPAAADAVAKDAPLRTGVLKYEPSSILYVDDGGNRWRLPYGSKNEEGKVKKCGEGRVCREVCTERDHFNAGGIYYELPAENAHGFAGVRPVTTHNWDIFDYGSWRGLFAVSLPGELRLMAIDDMWKVGKARGFGGPWKDTAVKAGESSDAYLLNGFDKKTLTLKSSADTTVMMEVDVTGWGVWVRAGAYELKAGATQTKVLPRAFGGYWVRFTSDRDAAVTAQLAYE